MKVGRIKELLGTTSYAKVRYKVHGVGCRDTEDLGRMDFTSDRHLIIHTENWASDYYRIPYDDITDIKPKGAKEWQR